MSGNVSKETLFACTLTLTKCLQIKIIAGRQISVYIGERNKGPDHGKQDLTVRLFSHIAGDVIQISQMHMGNCAQ